MPETSSKTSNSSTTCSEEAPLPKTRLEYAKLLLDKSEAGEFPSRNDSGRCAYRGCLGRRCVAGWIIPNGNYSPEMEGLSITHSRVIGRYELPEGVTFDMLRDIQWVHDSMDDPNRGFEDIDLAYWDKKRFKTQVASILKLTEVELASICCARDE